MYLTDVKERERFIRRGQAFNVLDGFLVVDDFQMLSQAFAANGQSCFQDQLRFAQGQGVALNGIGVVDPLQSHLLIEAPDGRLGQRAQGIQVSLLLLETGQQSGLKHWI